MGSIKSELRVCVVIPAFNESSVIGDVVKGVIKTFKNTPYSAEIVVVNDSSKDSTGVVAKKHGATVINHILNTGAGGATATGLSYAQQNGYDIACTMDADGQHDSSDVLEGVNQLITRNVDLLIGSRLINKQGRQ
jgi:glycosyltransferase involved in cell wall biosynthesis